MAVGDSFTEGLDDPYPDGVSFRGWADLVAGQLAAQNGPDFAYANLAVRGRLFKAVVEEQVPPTLTMKPDLVSFAAGVNDVLRRHFDATALTAKFDEVVGQLRAVGADVIVFRFAELVPWMPGRRVVKPRMDVLGNAVAETARRRGAYLIDLSSDDEFANPLLWSVDRLHLSTAGHRRVAAHVLNTLGVTPSPDWFTTPPRPAPKPWLAARGADLRWAGTYLAPWIKRRLTGKSSGDTITPKRPTLALMEDPD